MREIKFRGKMTQEFADQFNNGKRTWITGYYAPELLGGSVRPSITDGAISVQVDPATVGQYTGLKDRDGKEICEGDILAFIGAENPKAFFAIVEWDERLCCYYLRRIDVDICNRYGFFPSAYTLDGNIHDNPELLKGGKQ